MQDDDEPPEPSQRDPVDVPSRDRMVGLMVCLQVVVVLLGRLRRIARRHAHQLHSSSSSAQSGV